ncbi:VWA domain-containing protein [Methanolobus sp. ZRKC2]|uniref:VWA domain-containing protein n=1 Tax=Methanolobus sp. ZRKC2 TaxID=3125783 RepID=UPI00324E10CE
MDSGDVKSLRSGMLPFTAIAGQETAKKALMCALVCPDINGVLLSGKTACAKSTLARSLEGLSGSKRIINLPLNATYERIVGTLDIEKAVMHGQRKHHPGVLHEAHSNILFLDNINLFDDSIVETVLNASEKRSYMLEREGLSLEQDSDFILVSTMNPSEGEISSHLIDRFDIFVMMEDTRDRETRIQITRKCLEYERNPAAVRKQFLKEMQELEKKISAARERLQYVILPEGHLDLISSLVLEVGGEGHRGDIALSRVSRALAALDGRDQVNLEDIQEAALLTLEHRRKDQIQPENQNQADQKSSEENSQADSPENNQDMDLPGEMSHMPPSVQNNAEDKKDTEMPHNRMPDNSAAEQVFAIGDTFKVVDYLTSEKRMKFKRQAGRGKRSHMLSSENSGRYVSFRNPRGKVRDIALDATLRVAAPYQLSRDKKGLAVAVEKSDLREKVRLRKKGTTILFLVDASGSMNARKRMIAVKGAILSLLKDAYQKRDDVGMMAFYSDSAELLLPPTRSVYLAYRKLEELPTGGKTPLALGLSRSLELMMNMDLRSHGNDLVIVLISDCRANVPLEGNNALDDALKIAERSLDLPIRFVVVDTETGFPRFGLAEKMSVALAGSYFRLEELDAEKLATSVHATVHADISSNPCRGALIGGY